MTTPEPLLELTEEDRALVRSIYRPAPDDVGLSVEAGRQRAEWLHFCNTHRPFMFERGKKIPNPRFNFTPADWLALVEREVKE